MVARCRPSSPARSIRSEQGRSRHVDEASGPSLHVACSATFAMRWLVPHLAAFYRRHRDVRVRSASMTSAREDPLPGHAGPRDRLGPALDPERDLASARSGSATWRSARSGTPRHPLTRKRQKPRLPHAHSTTSSPRPPWTQWQEITGLAVTHESELRAFPTPISALRRRWPASASRWSSGAWVADDIAAKRLVAALRLHAVRRRDRRHPCIRARGPPRPRAPSSSGWRRELRRSGWPAPQPRSAAGWRPALSA